MPRDFRSFGEFYPYYLSEHRNPTCRRLHFVGTGLVIAITISAVATGTWTLLLFMPIVGYGFAWAGHFFFEKNKPATFRHPLYSLAGDFRMFGEMLAGRHR